SENGGGLRTLYTDTDEPSVVFMFSGLGSQYVAMGGELYQKEPVFRREMDHCFTLLKSISGVDLKAILYPDHRDEPVEENEVFNRFDIAQSVVFIFEYVLAKLLIEWGIRPDAMIGYSFGEYAAACIAGVFSLEDALKLIVMRGQLVEETAAGHMLSVPLPKEELTPLLPGDLSLAIDNGPSCIVAGSPESVAAFETQMKGKRYLCMRLPSTRALHSHMMEPLLKRFREKVVQLELKEPQIPFMSNVTGREITAQEAVDPGYWTNHLRQTVRFADGMKELVKKTRALFIEIGPGRDLAALAVRHLGGGNNGDSHSHQRVINLVRPAEKKISDLYYLVNKAGQIWLLGKNIHWDPFHGNGKRYRVPLPTYPFERRRYWIDGDTSLPEKMELPGSTGPADLFYTPAWKRVSLAPIENHPPGGPNRWLVFADAGGNGSLLVDRLKQEGHEVVTVSVGTEFSNPRPGEFIVDPRQPENYQRLFQAFASPGTIPRHIIHLWSLREEGLSFEDTLQTGFHSLLNIAKVLGKVDSGQMFQLNVITGHLQDVTGEEELDPLQATLLGPLKVIPQEYPNIRCFSIDIAPSDLKRRILLEQLFAEITHNQRETGAVIALRGRHRLRQVFEPIHPATPPADKIPIRRGGVYLITGGLGKIGMVLAKHLTEVFDANVILTRRSSLPPREQWPERSLVFQADAADRPQMETVIQEAEQRLGPIHGVIHAAGVTGENSFHLIDSLSPEACARQFQPKVKGTLVLADLFREKPLDFVWLMSSVSTVLGGLRFAAYASANAFMDTFANQLSLSTPGKWISVAWDGMGDRETVDAFTCILPLTGMAQVVVSNGGNLGERIDRWIKLDFLEEDTGSQKEDKAARHPRPQLINPYIPPSNHRQEVMAGIWENIFGYRQVGIDDDFFELGGDSLKATLMINKVHQALQVKISIEEVFRNPTIAQLCREMGDAGSGAVFTSVQPVEKRDYYDVSALQRRLFVVHGMAGIGTAYNLTNVLAVKGQVEKETFERIFKLLVHRHESLRTTFRLKDGLPVQSVREPGEVEFHIEAFDADGESSAKQVIDRFIRPFDLARPPLLRIGLVRFPDESRLLLFDMHHIISDGSSISILIHDFIEIYEGRTPRELPIQYKDFSHWQVSGSGREIMKKQEEYWFNRFKGDIPKLDMFTDFPRGDVQSFEGKRFQFSFGEELYQQTHRLMQETGATLYMVLLAVFNILLSRYTGQEDIAVGAPTAGRNHVDFENIVGVFINTLPIRNYPREDKTVREFLAEVKVNTLEAFENQEYQFGDLVETLGLRRDISRNPLYDVELVLQNMEFTALKIEGLEFAPFNYEPGGTQVDISFYVQETEKDIHFEVVYCSELYKQETIEGLTAFYKDIAAAVTENYDIKLKDIKMAHDFGVVKATAYSGEESSFDF
ncbi:MAG: SDR family NAD(P)-dependent oxidoreductase, partial [bacterium]|nr:SDR family NAD(P)-dependent oxidoreductase [bacterium]